MGKRIIQQARGKGSLTYRVRKKGFRYRVGYPAHEGEAKILKIVHSPAHSAPLLKMKISNVIFYNVAFEGAIEGEKINVGPVIVKVGNIIPLKNIPLATKIFNIERNSGDGGKMIRAAGGSALVYKKYDNKKIGIMMPNKKEIKLNENCRASIGIIAGEGRKQKPLVKAGKKFYKEKSKGKLWPRVSAVSVNAVDHPFGSGRGKKVKSKVAKRNSSPGQKVGHLSPKRTGRRKK